MHKSGNESHWFDVLCVFFKWIRLYSRLNIDQGWLKWLCKSNWVHTISFCFLNPPSQTHSPKSQKQCKWKQNAWKIFSHRFFVFHDCCFHFQWKLSDKFHIRMFGKWAEKMGRKCETFDVARKVWTFWIMCLCFV